LGTGALEGCTRDVEAWFEGIWVDGEWVDGVWVDGVWVDTVWAKGIRAHISPHISPHTRRRLTDAPALHT